MVVVSSPFTYPFTSPSRFRSRDIEDEGSGFRRGDQGRRWRRLRPRVLGFHSGSVTTPVKVRWHPSPLNRLQAVHGRRRERASEEDWAVEGLTSVDEKAATFCFCVSKMYPVGAPSECRSFSVLVSEGDP